MMWILINHALVHHSHECDRGTYHNHKPRWYKPPGKLITRDQISPEKVLHMSNGPDLGKSDAEFWERWKVFSGNHVHPWCEP